MTREEAAAVRAERAAFLAAIHRATIERSYFIDSLIRIATGRGNTLEWSVVEIES